MPRPTSTEFRDRDGRELSIYHLEGGKKMVLADNPVILEAEQWLELLADGLIDVHAPSFEALLHELRQRPGWPEVPG